MRNKRSETWNFYYKQQVFSRAQNVPISAQNGDFWGENANIARKQSTFEDFQRLLILKLCITHM